MTTITPASIAVALALVLATQGKTSAQGGTSRFEVSGGAALHRLWDDESSLGAGLSGGLGVSVAFSDSIRIRARVARSDNERDFGTGVVFEAIATRYAAELLWQPTPGAHALYFGLGAGGFAFTRRSEFAADPLVDHSRRPAERFRRTGNDAIVGGIAGFTAVPGDRFRLRPEASFWWSRPNNFLIIDVGLVAAWTF